MGWLAAKEGARQAQAQPRPAPPRPAPAPPQRHARDVPTTMSHTMLTAGAAAAVLPCCQAYTACTSALRAAIASSSPEICAACST